MRFAKVANCRDQHDEVVAVRPDFFVLAVIYLIESTYGAIMAIYERLRVFVSSKMEELQSSCRPTRLAAVTDKCGHKL
jgi:hypothetical protein